MPPCLRVLQKKIQRTNLIARIFKECDKNLIEYENPCEHGWYQNGNHFCIEFFDGDQFPNEVIEDFEKDAAISCNDIGDENIDEQYLIESDDDYESEEDDTGDEFLIVTQRRQYFIRNLNTK